ncbi:MAG: hypothetical protein LWY06_03705 [Firmicutes bacterium]|nr:hypothetical protein [Bacillota bacterium]
MPKGDELEKTIQGIKASGESFGKFLDEQREKNQQYNRINNLLTYLIVIVFAAFILFFYMTIKNNFTGERFLASIQKEAPDVLPKVSEHVSFVLADVGPTYQELAVQKFEEAIPEWSTVMEQEMAKFSDMSTEEAQKQLKTALTGAIEKQNGPLRQAFPGLKDEDCKTLIKEMEDELAGDTTDVINYVVENSINQIVTIKKTIDSFDTKGLPDDRGKLSKMAMHNILMILDQEVMEEGGQKIEHGKKWKKQGK